MATEATFTIRQVESNQPEAEPAEPPAKTTERPEQRKSVRRKKKKDKEEIKKTKKPPGNKWLQQKIPACRPVWMAKHVFLLFIIVGVVFIALGIGFLVTTARLRNHTEEYTNCDATNRDELVMFINNQTANDVSYNRDCGIDPDSLQTCEDYLCLRANLQNIERNNVTDGQEPTCMCQVNFTLDDDMDTPVYMYYSLHNYFQNHRRFVNSWSGNQLRAEDLTDTGTCEPLRKNGDDDDSGSTFLPCGIIANSMFNDTLNITTRAGASIDLDRNDISWQSDRDTRFQNTDGNTTIPEMDNVQPKNWQRNISVIPNSLQNEDLIVWFRVSAFPNFIKLYARIHGGTLPAGDYTLNVEYISVYNGHLEWPSILPAPTMAMSLNSQYYYPVNAFDGSKHLVLSENSWLGGRNLFLGIAYIIVGFLSIVSAVALIIIHLKFSRWKETDEDYLHREH